MVTRISPENFQSFNQYLPECPYQRVFLLRTTRFALNIETELTYGEYGSLSTEHLYMSCSVIARIVKNSCIKMDLWFQHSGALRAQRWRYVHKVLTLGAQYLIITSRHLAITCTKSQSLRKKLLQNILKGFKPALCEVLNRS